MQVKEFYLGCLFAGIFAAIFLENRVGTSLVLMLLGWREYTFDGFTVIRYGRQLCAPGWYWAFYWNRIDLEKQTIILGTMPQYVKEFVTKNSKMNAIILADEF